MSRRSRPSRTSTDRGNDERGSAGGERLQKVLAAAGVGSRRQCEELISEGRVEVDQHVVTRLGTRVDATRQAIRVDGVSLPKPKRVYYLVNKPVGVVTTNRDPAGRPRVIDLVPDHERLFSVGRLDRSSEGLILLTNDGELAQRLAHPRYGVEKTYRVEVAGHPSPQAIARIRQGVRLSDGLARVVALRFKRRMRQSTELEIVLNEGRNRELRRILARVGHKVLRLKRVALGPLRLAELPVGAYRPLSREEVQQLKRAARQAPTLTTPRRGRRPSAGGRGKGPAGASSRSTVRQRTDRQPDSFTGKKGVVLTYDVSPEGPAPPRARVKQPRRRKSKGRGRQ